MTTSPARGKRVLSFRAQTAALYGGLVIALALALSAAFGGMLVQQIHRDEGLALQVVASNAARTLATGLEERSREIEVLSRSESLWHEGLASDSVRQTLERTLAARPHGAWIGVAAPDGRVLAATGDMLLGLDVAARPWFQQGLAGTFVGDVHPAKLLAKLLPGPASGEPLRFLDFASPIVRDGRLVGVLGMHGSWEWARTVIESLVPPQSAAATLEVYIFDRQGQPIYTPSHHAAEGAVLLPVLGPEAGAAAVRTGPDGRDYLTAAVRVAPGSRVADLGWTVVAREPTTVAFAGARRSGWIALGIGALASAFAAGLAWVFSGRLGRPLSSIAKAARDVERGVPGTTIPRYAHNSEIAGLSEALSGMTERLLASNEALEQRVRERTAALQAANATLESLARHDPLTGLLNRRAFDERLGQALAQSRRDGLPISLLIVDADHFKQVNDRHGHEAGDHVLVGLAGLLKQRMRETDSVARLGGEEFAVLLPQTDAAQAMHVARQVVERMAATPQPGVGRVTVSIGVATCEAAPDAAQRLARLADEALYVAKRAGRNRAHHADAAELVLV